MLSYAEVIDSDGQAQVLYDLLRVRKYSISHRGMPDYDEHMEFVRNHPYRTWQIISELDKPVGTFYLTNDNAIGINLICDRANIYKNVISYIFDNWSPLGAVKSIRPSFFFIRVPIANNCLADVVVELKGALLEKSFIFTN
ncbi:MAG: hypothetical protein ACJ0Q3_10900 [Candidatus Azotimanducaceae bacterium]